MLLAELKDVAPRAVWEHEARDFTPWLAENLERLSQAIGIPLELEGTEVQVEQFAADVVAVDPEDGSRVLIENQLADSDHDHLGKILTYLAGVQAQTVVWVAPRFEEAHRSAVRWLNDHTVAPFAFFAVRVRVVQIADSPRALLFEVLEHPSAWDRRVRATVDRPRSERTKFRRVFWTYYAERHPDDGVPADNGASSTWIPVEAAELNVAPYLTKRSVGVCVRGGRRESPEAFYQRFRRWEAKLRDQLQAKDNYADEGRYKGRYAYSSYSCDTSERDNWPAMADWLHTKITEYRQVLETTPAPQPVED